MGTCGHSYAIITLFLLVWLSDDNKTLPDVQKYKHMKIHKKTLENALYDTSKFFMTKGHF